MLNMIVASGGGMGGGHAHLTVNMYVFTFDIMNLKIFRQNIKATIKFSPLW